MCEMVEALHIKEANLSPASPSNPAFGASIGPTRPLSIAEKGRCRMYPELKTSDI